MAAILQQFSDALATTVTSVSTGIVRVEARRRLPASGLVWSRDGIIVTTHHAIEQDDNIRVGLHSGQTVDATLVGRDATTDLAVLRVASAELESPAWAEPDGSTLLVGHLVLALGRPGQRVQATLGIVSALGANWRTPAGGLMDRYVQTDIMMYPGFSGGPLVNMSGQILGLNTSALLRERSLAIPLGTLRRVTEMLLAHGRMRRGYLGVSTQAVRLPAALSERLGQETGLLLITAESNSPAEQAGLLLGDTLVAL
ncbi:MAG TPA: trypsin-like peptidase domain-containing protein, partial [Candidatus Tectomicrobia bacterium]